MPPPGSFSHQVGVFAVNSTAEVERFRRAVSLKLFTSIIRDTPVDTGRLRANWQTNVAAPATGTLDSTDTAAAIQGASDNLGDGTGKDISVYFVNNLPYAQHVEYNPCAKHGKPGGHGMVRQNVARISALVRKYLSSGGKP